MAAPDQRRTWFERNALLASVLLLGVPLVLAGVLRSAGASDDMADLAQIVVGVAALVVVTVIIVRARR